MEQTFESRFLAARRAVIAARFQNLNAMQLEGVLTTQGPLLLLAGAGSGKTTVLINRIANLIAFGEGSDSQEVPDYVTEEDLTYLETYLKTQDPAMQLQAERLCALRPAAPWSILAITFTNEAARQYVGHPHKEIPARVALVRMILTFVEDFDKNMDKVIAERINKPCSRKQDPFVFLISVLCIDIAETFGQQMQITDPMALCVKVLANRCHSVVDTIMAEEDAADSAKS